MMRLALVVEYDGTVYRGFQYQTTGPTIQEELEKAISRFTGESVRIKGAGRTDTGVHARNQVVAFDVPAGRPLEKFVPALNFFLPDDIAVKAAYRVDEDFDPRRMALGRTYRYTVLNSPERSPLARLRAHRVEEPLSVRRMQRAAWLLAGEHDFRRFAGPLTDGRTNTVREIYKASVRKTGDVIVFDFEGNAFLPHQVRRMAGALIDLGRGKMTLAEFKSLIDGGAGEAVAHTLPPQGLCLEAVAYADFPPSAGEQNGNIH
jgi:tRNA pseudouridine38-40 synthase